MGRKKVILSVWEGNGKEIMRLVCMGGKWEGNYDIYWHCKEMGRKKILVLVGEGNGKENDNFVGVGRKKGREKSHEMSKTASKLYKKQTKIG